MHVNIIFPRNTADEQTERLHEAVLSLHLSLLGERHTTTASSKLRLEELRTRRGKSERTQKTRPRRRVRETIAKTKPALTSRSDSLAVRNKTRSSGESKPSFGGLARMRARSPDESPPASDPSFQSRKSSRRVESNRPSRKELEQPSRGALSSMAETEVPDERQSRSESAFRYKRTSNIMLFESKRPSTRERTQPPRGAFTSSSGPSTSSETSSSDESDSELERSVKSSDRVAPKIYNDGIMRL